MTVRPCTVLGARVLPLRHTDLFDLIGAAIGSRQRLLLGHHNLHSAYLLSRSPEMRRFFDSADALYIDGISIVLAGRVLGYQLRARDRLTCADWLPAFLSLARDRRWRVFHVGSTSSTAALVRRAFLGMYPGLALETAHGFLPRAGPSNDATVRAINTFRPDILLVGMGMPLQEGWLVEHWGRLETTVAVTVGGCVEYFVGRNRTPPRWAGPLGLEWLFRLVSDPRRLWRRYLCEPWSVARILRREFKESRSPPDA